MNSLDENTQHVKEHTCMQKDEHTGLKHTTMLKP